MGYNYFRGGRVRKVTPASKRRNAQRIAQLQRKLYNTPLNPRSLTRMGGFSDMYKKFVDYGRPATDLGDTIANSEWDPPTANCLNGIAQGNTENEYLGRGYDVMSIMVTGHIEWKNFVADTTSRYGELVRLLLVWDKQTNGAQFNAEDVLLQVTNGSPIDCPRNLEYTHRFIVLKDMLLKYPAIGFSDGGIDERVKSPFQIFHKFKKSVKVLTKDTGATVSSINDNSFHIMAFCSRASSHASLRYVSRIRFHG